MELFNEVRVVFDGSGKLASDMEKAGKGAAQVRKELGQAGKDIRANPLLDEFMAMGTGAAVAATGSRAMIPFAAGGGGRGGGAPPGPNFRIVGESNRALNVFKVGAAQAAQNLDNFNRIIVKSNRTIEQEEKRKKEGYSTAALMGTAAAAGAFSYKAMSLANPAAMERFQDALADTTAVIGHRLIPALEEMTALVRHFGDWLANHPTAASAIGYGALGVGTLATVGLGYKGASAAYSGLRGLASDVGGLFGASKAAGGAGGGVRGSTLITSEEMAAGRAVVPGTSEAAAATGTLGKLGKFGKFAGRASPYLAFLDPILTSYDLATAPNLNRALEGEFSSRGAQYGAAGPGVNFLGSVYTGGKYLAKQAGYTESDFDKAGRLASQWLWGGDKPDAATGQAGNRVSSFAAAARPTQYQDLLGAVMSLRQSITSGAGKDPAEETADNTRRSAEALEAMARGQNQGGSTQVPWLPDAARNAQRQEQGTPRGGR